MALELDSNSNMMQQVRIHTKHTFRAKKKDIQIKKYIFLGYFLIKRKTEKFRFRKNFGLQNRYPN